MLFFGTVRGGTNHSQQTAKHYIYTQSRLAYADDFWREYTLARKRSNALTLEHNSATHLTSISYRTLAQLEVTLWICFHTCLAIWC